MSDSLNAAINPYVGPNPAHLKFRDEFKYLNAFYYLFLSGRSLLQQHLKDRLKESDAKQSEDYVLGMVTHVISNSEFQGVHIARSDAIAMVDDFGGFLSLVSKHCVVSAHRTFIDYLYDLAMEAAEMKCILFTDEVFASLEARNLKPKKIAKIYSDAGIPLTENMELENQLRLLAERRNCIEHNAGKATQLFCNYAKEEGLNFGDRIPIASKQVGESLALIEKLASSLNTRFMTRFNLVEFG